MQPTRYAPHRASQTKHERPAPYQRLTISPAASAKRQAQLDAWSRGEARQTRPRRQPPRQHPALLRRLSLAGLPSGEGRAHATIIWLYLASLLRWNAQHTRVWPSNQRISKATRLSVRNVERGLAYLRASGKISVSYGTRPRLKKSHGRILELHLQGDGPNPVVHFPRAHVIDGIWHQVRRVRDKPAATVALAVVLWVLAAAHEGSEISEATSLHASLKAIRELAGAAAGGTFAARLDALADAGLISRVGTEWRSGLVVRVPEPTPPAAKVVARLAPMPLMRCAPVPDDAGLISLEELLAQDEAVALWEGWGPPRECAAW